MKKYIYLSLLLTLSAATAQAQVGIEQVLESVEANNKTLQAGKQMTEAQKLEANTGKYLANPTVELNQLWADRSAGGNVNELAVVQTFDFPTVYSNKNKLAKLKSATYDWQYAANRQQILLAAKLVCQEIVYLHKQKEILDLRLKNAERLALLYRERLRNGDANQIELNKIQLEETNAQYASRLNEAALRAQEEKLRNLNGGITIDFMGDSYGNEQPLPDYAQLEKEYLAADPTLKSLSGESETANREIRLSKAQSLPKFDLGYRRNGGSEEKMNGFKVGMSIPLWENKNTVKRAKAQAEYAAVNIDDNTQALKSTLRELYAQAQVLRNFSGVYTLAIGLGNHNELLNKALEAGQISMIDYFVEITLLYDSMQKDLDIRKEYHNIVAQLLQYTL